ncbi:unnamed protein product [Rhizoctonia solani]|uniref:Jacalin-type lectin domain-containing protein n=1 Tax=Rhizoctonia solani TaxID=456999 RepID=A0A8H3BWS9_9AGAM|nr:unnamed protein product [Rhizoctonia solani]
MPDPNPEEPRMPEIIPSQSITPDLVLTGVFLDPTAGPVTTNRQVAALKQSNTDGIIEVNESVTEDIYSQNALDAHYAQLGWPSPDKLPSKPWDVLTRGAQRTLETETWVTRRFMVQRVAINISPRDLCAVKPFVKEVEAALGKGTDSLRLQALREVFETWGEIIPVNLVAGAILSVTGTLIDGRSLSDDIPPTNPPSENRPYNLTEIVDRQLGIARIFEKRLESRVQGGSSEALLNEGYAGWLKSVAESPARWRVIKVYRTIPITDILSDQLRERVEKLYTDSLIYRSPSVGAPQGFGFQGATGGLRDIERITIWFTDRRVQDVSVTYTGGVVAGPYSFGIKNPKSQSDHILLAPGEYVTDLFVWHHFDGWIAGIQFVKNNLECSPIYGIRDRDSFHTHPPALLSGNGNALLGISGTYNSDNICQVKAVWRSDVIMRRKRHTQTSFAGGHGGYVFNDLQYLADPATSRIVHITARADGGLANLKTTYVSVSGGSLVCSEPPPRGSDTGPMKTMTLEEGEYIIGVRGSHNHGHIHQIQFVTNKKEHPVFGSDKGIASFSFDAPKTIDGKDMVLHYMAGKSGGCVHSLLFVWAGMPLHTTGA